jgi:hypothetical protein
MSEPIDNEMGDFLNSVWKDGLELNSWEKTRGEKAGGKA